MPKFSPDRAKELIPNTFRPNINGKTLYQRIAIARQRQIVVRHDHRLYIGTVVNEEVIEFHECHPNTIPESIIPNETAREIIFGESHRIEAFEEIEKPKDI